MWELTIDTISLIHPLLPRSDQNLVKFALIVMEIEHCVELEWKRSIRCCQITMEK